MSTRSYVGIIKDGRVEYGYHHSDSHLESLGSWLFNSIKSEKDFEEKINDFTNIDGETSRQAFFLTPGNDVFIEFCYAFNPKDNNWYVSSCHFSDATKTHKLTDIVLNDDEMNRYAEMYYDEYKNAIIEEIRENIHG